MLNRKIAVIGLGYVGLPVAISFAKKHSVVIGYDKNKMRIEELKKGYDRTLEYDEATLKRTTLQFTDNSDDLFSADFYIVAVPTPIDEHNIPDLSLMYKASEIIGKHLKKGDIVVYESTVYPGVTEEECLPILEKISGLKGGTDFTVGYSPERINPGDKEHTFEKITKIVAGQDQKTLDIVADVYGSVVTAGIYKASSIKVAEAAKVIENTQRDLNIAFMNELSIIFDKMGISTTEVIDAAATKWNFLPFRPGLVGGHCIGVDPYYLTYKAQEIGYYPEVILSGRKINDGMGAYIAEKTLLKLTELGINIKNATVVILGLTFKENCNDIRNSKVIDIFNTFKKYQIEPLVCDPLADPVETKHEYGIELTDFYSLPKADAIIIAVKHKEYLALSKEEYLKKIKTKGIFMDVKNVLDFEASSNNILIWKL
jgi:UDP-N-acetyl-D-galactosamine dehydrogenase